MVYSTLQHCCGDSLLLPVLLGTIEIERVRYLKTEERIWKGKNGIHNIPTQKSLEYDIEQNRMWKNVEIFNVLY